MCETLLKYKQVSALNLNCFKGEDLFLRRSLGMLEGRGAP
jgi:hypothetical protein